MEKHNRVQGSNSSGLKSWLSPQFGAYSGDLLDEKSKFLLLLEGLRETVLQMTGAYNWRNPYLHK